MRRSLVFTAFSALSLLAVTGPATAQSNPFVPKSSGGLTKEQVEEIVRKEAAANAARQNNTPSDPNAPAGPTANSPQSPTEGLPTQAGAPNGSPVAGTPGAAGVTAVVSAEDPVAALIADGGSFVGCVRAVPIFRDSVGRRIYFTSKELKASDAIKRYARC